MPIDILNNLGSVVFRRSIPRGIPIKPEITNGLSFEKSRVFLNLNNGQPDINKQVIIFNGIAIAGSIM